MVKMLDRKSYSLILLLLFIGTKAFSFHHLGHSFEDEEHHCTQCELAIYSDITPAMPADLLELPAKSVTIDSWIAPKLNQVCQQSKEFYHYSRPPPVKP